MRAMKHFTFTLLLICLAFTSFSQKKLDKTVDKANIYYKSMKYHKAIPLYEDAVATKGKHTLALRTKLAYCYRMLNQMDMAEILYAEIVTDNKANAITYYYYGEALMGNGKYKEAKEWFLKYDAYNPKDTRAITMVGACEKAKTLRPIFPDITLSRLPFNSDGDDYAPMIYGDDLLFISDKSEDKKREYEWTGRAFSGIYYARSDSAEHFSAEVLPFSRQFNKREKNSGPASLSGNQKYLFFSRNNDELNSSGIKYTMAIYYSERSVVGWKKPKKLPICNLNFNFMHPAASFTGDTLYFTSDKPGGFGETDIYMTHKKRIKRRSKKGDLVIIEKWMSPINLGKGINTAEREAFSYLANDGTLYFSSKGHAGFGGFDLFMSSMNRESIFEYSVNLGSNINSPKDDMSIILSGSGRTGYFASNRLSGTDDDIFTFRKGSKQIKIDGEVMSMETKAYLKNAKITLRAYDDENVAFSNERGVFNFIVKPGKEYVLKITLRGYAPYEYPIDATKLDDGEVLPFLIKLRQLEEIPYVNIDHEQSIEEEAPDLSMYEPEPMVINAEIDPYGYLPPAIPARAMVAAHIKKVVDEKQSFYRAKGESINGSESKQEVMLMSKAVEAPPELTIEVESIGFHPKEAWKSTVSTQLQPKSMAEAEPNKVRKKVKASSIKEKSKVSGGSKPEAQSEAMTSSKKERISNNLEEASIDKVEIAIPEKQVLPESNVNMMYMDLDIINEYKESVGNVSLHLMNEKGHLLENFLADYQGEIELELEANKTYMVKLEKDGFVTKTIMICTEGKSARERLGKRVVMKTQRVSTNLKFDTIYFDEGNTILSASAQVELSRVISAMNRNPKMVIEITGFTDASGDLNYETSLSKDRAMSAANFLIRRGIKPTRIIPKGKGAKELSNGCKEGIHCSEKLHQQNRRVIISVMVLN